MYCPKNLNCKFWRGEFFWEKCLEKILPNLVGRVAPLHAFEIIPDEIEVGSLVVGWVKKLRIEVQFHVAPVEFAEYDGGVRAFGDVIKTRAQFVYFSACAFGRDGNVDTLALVDGFDGVRHEIAALGFVNGNATQPTKNETERRAKQGVLADVVAMNFHRGIEQNPDREIPIRGVRRDGDHYFWQVIRVGTGDFPTPNFQNPTAERAEHFLSI